MWKKMRTKLTVMLVLILFITLMNRVSHRPKHADTTAPPPLGPTVVALPKTQPAPPIPLAKAPVVPVIPRTARKTAIPSAAHPLAVVAPTPTPTPEMVPLPTPETPAHVDIPPAAAQEWSGNADTSVTHPGEVVLRTEEQWNRFWAEHHPHEASPDVDFTRDMVVGVFVGTRPADAFGVRILSVQPSAETLVVSYKEQVPPPGTFSMGVTVHPYHLKIVPRSTLRVTFRKLPS